MSASEDLINFDIIETQKENIQSLPQGRSAKALASAFAPSIFSPVATPGSTRNLNDAIRQEYEQELLSIDDSDDPLDIYDRYVKWTMNAYPSAQATPESQLGPLLERATKAFQNVASYKNDPRYLKLWLNYIRFFSDAPRETFAYLARHSIGEGLALFYEEFAAWLESAGRWSQAEEVYKLGIEREARPSERLLRKFGEFQNRFEQRPRDADEPSSPALPTVRPALAAKLDPFATSAPRPTDPQAQRLPSAASSSRTGRQKLAIFSDADGSAAGAPATSAGTKGWDNIGSIEDRKKENTVEARPWAGETLKAGKKAGTGSKMMIFKDQSILAESNKSTAASTSGFASQQQTINAKTGRIERVFVKLDAVYPNSNDLNEEYSFDELRARHRGWLEKKWEPERSQRASKSRSKSRERLKLEVSPDNTVNDSTGEQSQQDSTVDVSGADQTLSDLTTNIKDGARKGKSSKPRKKRLMEVKGETQTIKINLESPTGPKIKRKKTAEPTMTLHTKAATDDILDIFNQPLRNIGPIGSAADADSGGESDYEKDDYTSEGESTGTGRISGATSEFGDDETGVRSEPQPDSTDVKSVSDWSDFTKSKHVPRVPGLSTGDEDDKTDENDETGFSEKVEASEELSATVSEEEWQVVTPMESAFKEEVHTRFIPIPPEDYEAPTHPYRDPIQVEQSRLPFMTPIVEKTETSVALPSAHERDYFNSKTPSRHRPEDPAKPDLEDLLICSPLQEIVNETSLPIREKKPIVSTSLAKKPSQPRPIIKDAQCNPVDETIRSTILSAIEPPLSSFPGFHDHSSIPFNKGAEIRKYVKALSKPSSSGEKTTSITIAPIIRFPDSEHEYTIKRELGKGAYAPVYLVEQTSTTASQEDAAEEEPTLLALKSEKPPSPWEFYIMHTLYTRLSSSPLSRTTSSLAKPYSLHLFADECYLLESYHAHGTLLDLVNASKSPDSHAPLDEITTIFFTVELLRTVSAMHSIGVLHGDLKADNCLLRLPSLSDAAWSNTYSPTGEHGWAEKGIVLIDFGRGIDMTAFTPTVGFLADWKTDKSDCVEMRELRPWTKQIDYWGIAGLVHLLLYGRWIEDVVDKTTTTTPAHPLAGETGETNEIHLGDALGRKKRYKLKESFKRYWQVELWGAMFDVLLNPTSYAELREAAESSSEAAESSEVCTDGGRDTGMQGAERKLREIRERFEEYLVENSEKKGLKSSLRRWEERLVKRR